ncbi:uncharacterized protein LOC142581872 [Dermacentor variabilis]|uniref:uncharacterized protein LOC142581872 n=1 Tax=Dermacentor variabilis TaxID=34621 RepID=UPI003F5B4D7F
MKESPTHKTLETSSELPMTTEKGELAPALDKLTASPAQLDSAMATTKPPQEQSRDPKTKSKRGRSRAPSMARQGVPADLNVLSPPSPEQSLPSRKPKPKESHGLSTRSGRARGSEAGQVAPSHSSDQAKQLRSKVSIGKPADRSKKGKFADSHILPAETTDGTRTEHEPDIDTTATTYKSKRAVSDTTSKSKMRTLAPRNIPSASTSDATSTRPGIVTASTMHVDMEGKTNGRSEHQTEIVAGVTEAEHVTMVESQTIAKAPPMQTETPNRGHDAIRNGVTTAIPPKALRVEQRCRERRVHGTEADVRSAIMYSTLKELASTDITTRHTATLVNHRSATSP